ncbi:MAG: hypothetical protein BWY94_02327 [Actinobacteria bacterium ADurb.BinA094]|nr:MAG: hypothetical protein BWY94_02327 [Actinobacteria bacterium ADurb.BinA094]
MTCAACHAPAPSRLMRSVPARPTTTTVSGAGAATAERSSSVGGWTPVHVSPPSVLVTTVPSSPTAQPRGPRRARPRRSLSAIRERRTRSPAARSSLPSAPTAQVWPSEIDRSFHPERGPWPSARHLLPPSVLRQRTPPAPPVSTTSGRATVSAPQGPGVGSRAALHPLRPGRRMRMVRPPQASARPPGRRRTARSVSPTPLRTERQVRPRSVLRTSAPPSPTAAARPSLRSATAKSFTLCNERRPFHRSPLSWVLRRAPLSPQMRPCRPAKAAP